MYTETSVTKRKNEFNKKKQTKNEKKVKPQSFNGSELL